MTLSTKYRDFIPSTTKIKCTIMDTEHLPLAYLVLKYSLFFKIFTENHEISNETARIFHRPR